MLRARMAMCRTAIESRALGLTPEPKIMSKLLGTAKIRPLQVWDPAARACRGCAEACRAVPQKRWILTISSHKIFLSVRIALNLPEIESMGYFRSILMSIFFSESIWVKSEGYLNFGSWKQTRISLHDWDPCVEHKGTYRKPFVLSLKN